MKTDTVGQFLQAVDSSTLSAWETLMGKKWKVKWEDLSYQLMSVKLDNVPKLTLMNLLDPLKTGVSIFKFDEVCKLFGPPEKWNDTIPALIDNTWFLWSTENPWNQVMVEELLASEKVFTFVLRFSRSFNRTFSLTMKNHDGNLFSVRIYCEDLGKYKFIGKTFRNLEEIVEFLKRNFTQQLKPFENKEKRMILESIKNIDSKQTAINWDKLKGMRDGKELLGAQRSPLSTPNSPNSISSINSGNNNINNNNNNGTTTNNPNNSPTTNSSFNISMNNPNNNNSNNNQQNMNSPSSTDGSNISMIKSGSNDNINNNNNSNNNSNNNNGNNNNGNNISNNINSNSNNVDTTLLSPKRESMSVTTSGEFKKTTTNSPSLTHKEDTHSRKVSGSPKISNKNIKYKKGKSTGGVIEVTSSEPVFIEFPISNKLEDKPNMVVSTYDSHVPVYVKESSNPQGFFICGAHQGLRISYIIFYTGKK